MKKTVPTIVNIYVLVMFLVFPVIMTDTYYNIQGTKLYFYLYSTIITTVLVVLAALWGPVSGKPWDPDKAAAGRSVPAKTAKAAGRSGSAKTAKAAADKEKGKGSLFAWLKAHMKASDWFALLFGVTVIVSTLCSEWRYEAFWGNMGRYQGCYLLLWYLCTYFLISRFYTPRRWHMDLLVLSGLVVCVWGVLDCFWMSPVNWQIEHMDREKAFDFSSTIGNVNVLTAVEGMYLMIASALYIGDETKPADSAKERTLAMFRPAYYYIAACAAFMGLVCGCSDNALVSVATAVCFLPFFAFRSMKSTVRYGALLAGYFGTMVLTGLIGNREGQRVVIEWKWGELLKLSIHHPGTVLRLWILALILLGVLLAIWRLAFRKNSASGAEGESWTSRQMPRKLRMIWAGLGILAVCVLIFIFYDANHGGHPELYAPFRKVLIFDDAWGTHRGYNWRLSMKYFREFPLFRKLVGSGPETYGIFTHVYDHYNMLNMFNETYDSPHNEWLQYLFTTGILGFIGYYGMVKCVLWNGFGIGRTPSSPDSRDMHLCGVAAAYAVQAYTLQSFVNISIPVVVPLVFVLIGVCAAIKNE